MGRRMTDEHVSGGDSVGNQGYSLSEILRAITSTPPDQELMVPALDREGGPYTTYVCVPRSNIEEQCRAGFRRITRSEEHALSSAPEKSPTNDESNSPRRRRVVAAAGGTADPAVRASSMNRNEFMDWAADLLAVRLSVPYVSRDNDNNIHHVLADDVYIGIVATVEATIPSPRPCIRVHISSIEPRRIRRWEHGWRPRGVAPDGVQLALRVGDRGKVRYLEFSWINHDLNRFQLWMRRVEQCVNLFISARDAGAVESSPQR